MEILLLFVLNIFTGALIYLLLSLKIERTSSTFQEQKLKKEMGSIITEFNATAERNITLLEARIAVLKRLLGETGNLKSMDITLDHKPDMEKIVHDNISSDIKNNKSFFSGPAASAERIITKNAADIAEIGFNEGIADKLPSFGHADGVGQGEKQAEKARVKKQDVNNSYVHPGVFQDDSGRTHAEPGTRGGRIDFVSNDRIDIAPDSPSLVQFENPADLFVNAENKYSLIAELHGRGYSVDDLAEYSGLPAGEVRLVISLNK